MGKAFEVSSILKIFFCVSILLFFFNIHAQVEVKKNGTTKISGQIISPTSGTIGVKFYRDFISRTEEVFDIPLVDNKFSITFQLNYSSPIFLIYNGEEIPLETDFLTFEHTDGLNYLSFNFDRIDAFWISKNKKYNLNFIEGLGLGMIFPKSNVKLMGDHRDEWHIAGYGISAHIAIRFDFLRHFFIQGQLEGGFINMPDIVTTGINGARASQNFFYFEQMLTFGGYIPLIKQK